jgi:WD40 repeat protein
MATGGAAGELLLWEGDRAASSRIVLEGHHETVYGVTFDRSGQRLASGGGKGELFLWDLAKTPPTRESLKWKTGDIRSVAFSPDGMTLATAGTNWEVVLWDLGSDPKRPKPIDGMGLNGHEWRKEKATETNARSVAFSPDGRLLATGGEDFRVTVWDLSGREPGPRMLPDVIKGWVQSLAFSPDGKTLAAGSWYDDVTLGDVGSWTRRPRLIGPRVNAASVSFSPDGKILASGGEGMAVVLWDLAPQRCSGELREAGEKSVRGVVFAPDGHSVISVAEGGAVTRWNIEFSTWVREACAVANRNLTEEEWRGYIGGAKPYRKTCPDATTEDYRDHSGR